MKYSSSDVVVFFSCYHMATSNNRVGHEISRGTEILSLIRSRTFSVVTFRASYSEHKISTSGHVDRSQIPEPSYPHSQPTLNYHYSSLAGTKTNGEEDDDLVDGFSELEDSTTYEVQEKNVEDESNDGNVSEPELS
ncbi:putative EF-Hand 1, calcium-binding protein [Helianthus annuus]|nr:putative EF-Hand 1, calcium-binding protein [Helianthus annuus]